MTQPLRRQALAWLAAAPAAALLSACGGGDLTVAPPAAPAQPSFTAEGLAGRIVHRLRPLPGGGLLAATDDGLYQRSASGAWQARNLPGEHVFDVTALSPTHWLASVRNAAAGVDAPPRLLETTTAGQAWQVVIHNFGGDEGPETIHALMNDAAGARLLATGFDVLAQSRDGGRTWQRLAGEYQAIGSPKSALALDPQLGDVWFGGQNAVEVLALFRWRQSDGQVIDHPGLMTTPSVVKGIRFSQGQPARVLVAGEGGVVHSLDRGGQWRQLFTDGHNFYFDVVQDPQRPQRWVTARWEKSFEDPQRVVVRVSDDDGATWRELVHGDAQLFGGAWSLAASIEGGRTMFHLGLYKGGVMRLELP
jgi:hypothetical protein